MIPRVTATGESAHASDDSGGLVLVLNSGSSSVKFAVLAPASGERVMAGMAEKVGTPETELRIRRYPDRIVTEQLPEGSHRAVISRILDHLPQAGSETAEDGGPAPGQARLASAGHRVVQMCAAEAGLHQRIVPSAPGSSGRRELYMNSARGWVP